MASSSGTNAVIGACSAYFLGKKGLAVTTAASGKAGGFLALDWCDNSPLNKLARASFSLHEQLAAQLNGGECYGCRKLDTLSVTVDENVHGGSARLSQLPAWIDGCTGKYGVIGTTRTTAESKFGAKVIKGNVEEVKVDPQTSKVVGVMVDGKLIEAQRVVIALGPWCGKLKLVSDLTSLSGLKAHSIVLRPVEGGHNKVTPHALFLSYTCRDGRKMDPEVYPRATGEVYVCGMSESGTPFKC